MSMIDRRRFGASLALLALAARSRASDLGDRPVRLVLPYSAGSGPDAVARRLAEQMVRAGSQPVLVDNRPGANGWLAAGEVKRAKPDGATWLVTDNTGVALQPLLYRQMPFDPVRDFEPVAPLYTAPFFIAVASGSPWRSVADLAVAARKRQGGLSYGSSGIGSVPHLGGAMLAAAIGSPMVHVAYKDMPAIYTDVATGAVDWAFGTAATAGPLVRSARLRFLALASASRAGEFPDVPTIAESGGYSDFVLRAWVGLYAPSQTSRALIDERGAAVQKALATPALADFFKTVGFEAWFGGPDDLRRAAAADARRFVDVIAQAGIRID